MKAPITWPPIFAATTNIRTGTRSASENFHTSFCSAKQACISASAAHLRMITSPVVDILVAPVTLVFSDRSEVRIRELPSFFLQRKAGRHLRQRCALADDHFAGR